MAVVFNNKNDFKNWIDTQIDDMISKGAISDVSDKKSYLYRWINVDRWLDTFSPDNFYYFSDNINQKHVKDLNFGHMSYASTLCWIIRDGVTNDIVFPVQTKKGDC